MQEITIDLVMDRLLVNPLFKGLRYSTVASYMRDFSSINGIEPILRVESAVVLVEDYKGVLPNNLLELKAVYLCADRDLDPTRFEDNRLGASTTDAILRPPKDGFKKDFYGAYMVQDDIITLDAETAILEVQYRAMRVDANGFPVLPYDGSLMMAITNFVKWQHLDLLSDSEMVSAQSAQKAHREYVWYVGQYTSKKEVPTYDEAVSWGNTWTRLLDTRNKSKAGDNIEQHYTLGNNFYGLDKYGRNRN